MSIEYRKDIDGLRALAVMPVILFHAGFDSFGGGYVGVDVFFVISGYLITSIILLELNAQTFSLASFYERRARRIIPALFFVMAISTVSAFIWLPPEALEDFGSSLVAVSIFSSNFLFWQETGYWGPVNELNPLLHTWSLAVEEQFYLLFPLLLIFVWWLDKRWIFPALLLIFLLSLLMSQWGAVHYPEANFFLLHARAWELAVGAVLALRGARSRDKVAAHSNSKIAHELCSFIGLGSIFLAVFLFNERTPFPSIYALLPTIGAALLISTADGTLCGRLLSSRGLVFCGLLSYGAYLWHQPIFAFARRGSVNEPTAGTMILLCILSFALAFISWKFIEAPFRSRSFLKRTEIFGLVGVGSLIFIMIGSASLLTQGFPQRYSEELRPTAELRLEQVNLERHRRLKELCRQKISPRVCGKISDRSLNVLIVGDSHGPDGLNIFASAYPTANFLLSQRGGCPLLKDLTGIVHAYRDCDSFNKQRFHDIDSLSRNIDLVVISQRMSNRRLAGTKELVKWFYDLRLPVILLGAGPQYSRQLADILLQVKDPDDIKNAALRFQVTRHFDVDNILIDVVRSHGGEYIIKTDYFCPGSACVPLTSSGQPIVFDHHHLTLDAAEAFGRFVGESKPTLLRDLLSK